jgi:hypothetical protein
VITLKDHSKVIDPVGTTAVIEAVLFRRTRRGKEHHFYSCMETLIKLLRNNNQIDAAQVNGNSESLSKELYLMCNRPGVMQVPFQALI